MGNCINVATPPAGGKAVAGDGPPRTNSMLQRQKAKGQPSELRERSRRLSASLEGTQLESGSSAASSVGKRRNAAGAPVAPPRALPQSFLTRKESEFGVLRPQQINKITSRYTICEKLGEGNTATVRRCIDKRDGKERAMKIFRKTRLSLVDVTSLLEEVSILAHLRHPHVTAFVGFIEDAWYYYVVMELVRGGELFERISKKTTYTERDARCLFKVLTGTIEYLHSCNVVHRDIKPENLLMASEEGQGDDCNIKLADFGYAVQVWPDEPGLRSQCGTPCYIAPEILKREYYGKPVDMWSAGVVLYILLCGYAPFYDEDQRRLFDKIKRGRYCFDEDAWGDISREAKDLIMGLLQLDPAKRLTAAEALRHPWVLVADDELTSHGLSKAQVEIRKFNARRKFRASVRSIIMVHRMRRLSTQRTNSPPPASPTSSTSASEDTDTVPEIGMRRLLAAARAVDEETKSQQEPVPPAATVQEMVVAVGRKVVGRRRSRESSGGDSDTSEATVIMAH